ncbi:MAG: hypothetical protein ACRDZO_10010 [Egibacteraceae bacterium]
MSGGLEALAAWVTADELVCGIQRDLREAGATFDDLDERIAAELGVPVEAWCGYVAVKLAADRYQGAAARAKRRDAGGRE